MDYFPIDYAVNLLSNLDLLGLGSSLGGLLLAKLGGGGLLSLLLHLVKLLLSNNLDVGGGTLVGIDTAVSTVSSSAHLGGLISLGVCDNALLNIQTLHLSVSLNVRQKSQIYLGGLLRPSNFIPTYLVFLSDRVPANTTGVLRERNAILVLQHVLQILLSLSHRAPLDGLTDLTAVLVVHTDVSGASLGHYTKEIENTRERRKTGSRGGQPAISRENDKEEDMSS